MGEDELAERRRLAEAGNRDAADMLVALGEGLSRPSSTAAGEQRDRGVSTLIVTASDCVVTSNQDAFAGASFGDAKDCSLSWSRDRQGPFCHAGAAPRPPAATERRACMTRSTSLGRGASVAASW